MEYINFEPVGKFYNSVKTKTWLTNVQIEDDLLIQGLLNFSWENFIIAVRQRHSMKGENHGIHKF